MRSEHFLKSLWTLHDLKQTHITVFELRRRKGIYPLSLGIFLAVSRTSATRSRPCMGPFCSAQPSVFVKRPNKSFY